MGTEGAFQPPSRDGQGMQPSGPAAPNAPPALEACGMTYRYGGGATIHTRGYTEPKLADLTCSIPQGSRVLVAGANGAGKSTLLSIMGGKRMVPRGDCRVAGREAFHDPSNDRMYCGDWWRTDFFWNITVAELIGEKRLETSRAQRLIDIMQVNLSWRINSISDGQRRRCQLLDSLVDEKQVYILDEITTDLDLFAREGILRFLRAESEERGASVFYATHIFDALADWATHLMFFSGARLVRSCRMEELSEYHQLVAAKTRVPLYALMRDWVFRDYVAPPSPEQAVRSSPSVPAGGPAFETRGLSFSYAPGLPPALRDVSVSFERGSRILVVGANGACKSTLMSILGGKRMLPRGLASVLGKDCFNEAGAAENIMYCGDWWRTKFFMNLQVAELLGEATSDPRCRHLMEILQVNAEWKINDLSDGQRRRVQLLECLRTPRPVYLMDEITSDLDIFAREGVLRFLRAESEIRGATIVYCTHIFDHLEGWASHVLHMSKGSIVRACPFGELEEYAQLVEAGDTTPLYSMFRRWIYSEYAVDGEAKPWRELADTSDGRRPMLGLAGPFALISG